MQIANLLLFPHAKVKWCRGVTRWEEMGWICPRVEAFFPDRKVGTLLCRETHDWVLSTRPPTIRKNVIALNSFVIW